MLTTIRDKATGWVAGIIVGALIISFAFWGVSFYFGQGSDVNVASVNGTDIKLQTYQRSFYNIRKQMQSIFGDDLSAEEDEVIKDQTIQKLINTEIINQFVMDSGLRVTDARVIETIKNLELFKDEDGFDRTKYERGIHSLGMGPVFFEAQLRMDLLSEQLQAGLAESVFVINTELNDVIRLKLQSRDISYTILEIDNYIEDGEIDEADIESFYKANPQDYAEPEKVKITYLELDVDEMAKDIEANEEELRTYYQDNKEKYDVTEQRSVTKLFVKTGEEATEDDKTKAKTTIDSAMKLAEEGKDFEEIIEIFNKDGKGLLEFSEHAFMAKGILEKEVDEFLFNSDEDAISGIIETKKGFNIVKVGEIRGGPKNIYENSAEQVEKDYKYSQAELQYFELADQLTTLAYEHSDNLEIAAEAIDHKIVETDYFSRDQELDGVLANPAIISNSFNPELISSQQNSDAIELSDNHIVVLRVLEHKVATTKPLNEVRDQVISDIRDKNAKAHVKQIGDAIVEKLNSGSSTDDVASEYNVEWSFVEKVNRDDINVNRAVLREAFRLGKSDGQSALISGQVLGSGDYAVVMVTAEYDGQLDNEDKGVEKATDLELRRARSSYEWEAFLNNARDSADVSIYEDNI
ncbi:MAG: SurA N-terminal domain-containing protein [Proteobacteria bacterium]|nr:SurA N-terminal domain-containing protein [Pseudomonadota bacterium]